MTNPTDDLFEESQLNKDGQESLESYIKKIRKLSTSFPNEYPEEDLIFKINLGETLYQSRILYGLEIFQKLADDKILTKYQTHWSPDGWVKRMAISKFKPWAYSCPMACLDTSYTNTVKSRLGTSNTRFTTKVPRADTPNNPWIAILFQSPSN